MRSRHTRELGIWVHRHCILSRHARSIREHGGVSVLRWVLRALLGVRFVVHAGNERAHSRGNRRLVHQPPQHQGLHRHQDSKPTLYWCGFSDDSARRPRCRKHESPSQQQRAGKNFNYRPGHQIVFFAAVPADRDTFNWECRRAGKNFNGRPGHQIVFFAAVPADRDTFNWECRRAGKNFNGRPGHQIVFFAAVPADRDTCNWECRKISCKGCICFSGALLAPNQINSHGPFLFAEIKTHA